MGLLNRIKSRKGERRPASRGETTSTAKDAIATGAKIAGFNPEKRIGPVSYKPFLEFFGVSDLGECADDSVSALLEQLGGLSLGNGLMRLLTLDEQAKWENIVRECVVAQCKVPVDFSFSLFASTWNGYCIGVRNKTDMPEILLFDVETMEINSLDSTLEDYLNERIPSRCNGCLASYAYSEWLETHPEPKRNECVGLTKPLFLGGKDDFDNMEIIDMEVQWEMTSQIWQAVRDLPPGTPIGSIRFE